jgi:ankyrin repeat protein
MRLLHSAVINGNYDLIRVFVENGADINMVDMQGSTALFPAAMRNCHNSVRVLVENGISINHSNTRGRTALFTAVLGSHYDLLRTLMKNGAKVNITDDCGQTALHFAVFGNYHDSARFLIANGADINIIGWLGRKVPQFSACCAEYDRCRFTSKELYRRRARINNVDHPGRTALHCDKGSREDNRTADLVSLLKQRTDISTGDEWSQKPSVPQQTPRIIPHFTTYSTTVSVLLQ